MDWIETRTCSSVDEPGCQPGPAHVPSRLRQTCGGWVGAVAGVGGEGGRGGRRRRVAAAYPRSRPTLARQPRHSQARRPSNVESACLAAVVQIGVKPHAAAAGRQKVHLRTAGGDGRGGGGSAADGGVVSWRRRVSRRRRGEPAAAGRAGGSGQAGRGAGSREQARHGPPGAARWGRWAAAGRRTQRRRRRRACRAAQRRRPCRSMGRWVERSSRAGGAGLEVGAGGARRGGASLWPGWHRLGSPDGRQRGHQPARARPGGRQSDSGPPPAPSRRTSRQPHNLDTVKGLLSTPPEHIQAAAIRGHQHRAATPRGDPTT